MGGVLYINGGTFRAPVESSGNMIVNGGEARDVQTVGGGNTTVNGRKIEVLWTNRATTTIESGARVCQVDGSGGTANLNTADIQYFYYSGGTVNFGDNVLSIDKSSLSLDTVDERTENLSVQIGSTTIEGYENLPVFWENSKTEVATDSGSMSNAEC